MTATPSISQLTVYIEENLRAQKNQGIQFVDPRQVRQRFVAKQNHVIFGRRGAGKTRLMGAVKDPDAFLNVYINLEDVKDQPLPDIILGTLARLFSELEREIKKNRSWLSFKAASFRKKIRKLSEELRSRLDDDRPREKRLAKLRREIPEYKKWLLDISEFLGGKALYLSLDDFYFIARDEQADLADYFHRLTKDSPLFLKVATIKDRSELYRSENSTYVGMELGHDAYPIDMDYTLDSFEELENFMNDLLQAASKDSGADVDAASFFKEDGFKQLCLASEGVPRDFLSLFVKVANKYGDAEIGFIGKEEVLEAMDPNATVKRELVEKGLPEKKGFISRLIRFFKRR